MRNMMTSLSLSIALYLSPHPYRSDTDGIIWFVTWTNLTTWTAMLIHYTIHYCAEKGRVDHELFIETTKNSFHHWPLSNRQKQPASFYYKSLVRIAYVSWISSWQLVHCHLHAYIEIILTAIEKRNTAWKATDKNKNPRKPVCRESRNCFHWLWMI